MTVKQFDWSRQEQIWEFKYELLHVLSVLVLTAEFLTCTARHSDFSSQRQQIEGRLRFQPNLHKLSRFHNHMKLVKFIAEN